MKAVLVPIAHGYGSTVRLLAVANELRARGHRAVFAIAESIGQVVRQYGFESHDVAAVPIDEASAVPTVVQILGGEARGDFLERQVNDVRRVIREVGAEIVIFSNSNAAAIAAGAEDRPSISIFDPSVMQFTTLPAGIAIFLKWRKFFALKKEIPLRRDVPSSLLGDLNFIPSIPPLIYWPYTQPPELYFRSRPVKNIGALLRTKPEDLPSQDELKAEFGVPADQPFIYASVGGAIANPDFLERIVAGLHLSGHQTLLTAGVSSATADRLSDSQVRMVRFYPEALRAIKACDVLVWHGGHETMLEAVAVARPAIGIPYQFDQHENVTRLVQAGAGLKIDRANLVPSVLAEAIDRVLNDGTFAQQARYLQRINDSLGGVTRLVDSAEALVTRGRRV